MVAFSCSGIKEGDIISYLIRETGVAELAEVVSRGGKATGPNKFWWNVHVLDSNEDKCVNTEVLHQLRKVNKSSCTPPVSALVVTISRYLHGEPECVEAKWNEIKNWTDFGAFVEVKDVGQKTINTNWVLVQKDTGVKARLCIPGDSNRFAYR